jgi:hypothetical protein
LERWKPAKESELGKLGIRQIEKLKDESKRAKEEGRWTMDERDLKSADRDQRSKTDPTLDIRSLI